MPRCSYCGTTTKHLHTGGDARIPGDGVDEGACSACETELASKAREQLAAKRKTAIQTKLAAATGGD